MNKPARCLLGLGWLAVSCALTVGCAAETEEEETDASEAELRRESYSGHKITKERVATLVRAAGFPERLVWPMTCVAYYESKFDVGAVGYNSATSIDRGLFQINSVHVRGDGTDGCPTAAADLDVTRYVSSLRGTPRTSSIYDPATNARCAHGVYESRPGNGMLAWNAYRAHRAECDRATSRWTPSE